MIFLDGKSLSINDVISVARNGEKVSISKEAIQNIEKSRKDVISLVEKNEVVYGVTTGFGSLANKFIPKENAEELQKNIIRSHAVGVDQPFSEEEVRAIMLIRINTLAKGFSGIRIEVLNTLIEMLNQGVHPIIPKKGSVGASGDLIPLSHMALVLIGEGEAIYQGNKILGKEAMEKAKINPIKLSYKEGLALTNGTAAMTAVAALTLYDSEKLLETAEVSAALSLEALRAREEAFDDRIHKLRNQGGQIKSAEKIRDLIKESKLINSNKEKIQDSYSLRCVPQVHGAVRDTIEYVKKIITNEINAATDNPLIIDGKAISGGNFHGEPIAFAMDFLGIALSELANISERRIAKLLDKNHNDGLPAFLIEKNGVNSGLMIPQYTAAALVSENKMLAHPSSVDSIPTSANQEDHVSMGTTAARKAKKILTHSQIVLAIEFLTSCQAIEFRGKENLGIKTRKAYEIIRKEVDPLQEDRVLNKDILRIDEMIKQKKFLEL